MNKELTAYFESGCNAILAAAMYVLNNYNILSYSDIYHDYSSFNTSINNMAKEALKLYLSHTHVPIYNIDQIDKNYNDISTEKNLHYWIINPINNPIEPINNNQEFSITLVLMYNQKRLLSIVSVPSEDKLYFELSSKSIFIIEGLQKIKFDLPAKYLLAVAKPLSIGGIDSKNDSDQKEDMENPKSHYWLG